MYKIRQRHLVVELMYCNVWLCHLCVDHGVLFRVSCFLTMWLTPSPPPALLGPSRCRTVSYFPASVLPALHDGSSGSLVPVSDPSAGPGSSSGSRVGRLLSGDGAQVCSYSAPRVSIRHEPREAERTAERPNELIQFNVLQSKGSQPETK